jgi:hypothetical protein
MAVVALGHAQTLSSHTHAGMVLGPQTPPPAVTAKETLQATYLSSSSTGVSATCSVNGCLSSSVPLYTSSIICPARAGKTCTYDVLIAGQVKTGGNNTDAGDNGLFQFLVDGVPPSGGGTDSTGLYSWQFIGEELMWSSSYDVHSTVKNTVANQAHTVTVNLACEDDLFANGCFADAGFTTLTVRVWTP